MRVAIISVPYQAGTPGEGVGLGPAALRAAGIAGSLTENGVEVREEEIELAPDVPPHELARVVGLQCAIATSVRRAVERSEFPLILAGNCSSAVGVLAGLGRGAAIAWFDAHADFNTPDTTRTGMIDGMALAMSTGRCLRTLAATVPNFAPAAEDRVLLIGARDLDPAEEIALKESPLTRVSASLVHELPAYVAGMFSTPPPLYLHLDLDVLDPVSARANRFAAPNGLTPEALRVAIAALAASTIIQGMAVTAYDPAYDRGGRVAAIAIEAVQTAVQRCKRT